MEGKGKEAGFPQSAHFQRKLGPGANLQTLSSNTRSWKRKEVSERGNILPQVSGRPGTTHCIQDALSSTLEKRLHGFIPPYRKGEKKKPILLNFHSGKIADIYPSPGLQKSRLLFCKHHFALRGLFKSREGSWHPGHLREAEGRPR